MAASSSAPHSQASFHTLAIQILEDPVSYELMTRAVTVLPCGHVLNEGTVIDILARDKLCPLDMRRIDDFKINYNIRALALAAESQPSEEEKPSPEAEAFFSQGKKLADKGDYKAAVEVLFKALEIRPNHEKAHAYFDFCLQQVDRDSPLKSPSSLSPISSVSGLEQQKIKRELPSSPKDQYTDLLLTLLEEPLVQSKELLKKTLADQVEELMSQTTDELTEKQKECYKWTQKLFADSKIRQFVAEKLQKTHQNISQVPFHPSVDKTSSSSPLQAIYSNPPTIQLFGVTPMGQVVTINISPTAKIANLRKIISTKLDIPTDSFRLIYIGKWLEDDRIIRDYNIPNESKIRIGYK